MANSKTNGIEVSYNSETKKITKRSIATGEIIKFGRALSLDVRKKLGVDDIDKIVISNDGTIVLVKARAKKGGNLLSGYHLCLISFDLETGNMLSESTFLNRGAVDIMSAYGEKSFKLNKSLNGIDFYTCRYDGMTGKMYKITSK